MFVLLTYHTFEFPLLFKRLESFPALAPQIAAMIDNTHPLKKIAHIDVAQKLGSTRAAIIPGILQRIGTYQTLLGFFRHIKKQAKAMIIAKII